MFNVGDIINEKYYPDRIGVVIEVLRKEVLVRWHRPNPNSRCAASHLEKLNKQYIELAKGEDILNET